MSHTWFQGWRALLFIAPTPIAFLIGLNLAAASEAVPPIERPLYRSAVLTSPYLETSNDDRAVPAFARAEGEILSYVDQSQRADPTLEVAVYAKDLDGGASFGINDHERFLPSSLTKVAILLHTLHRDELDPGLLDRPIVFPGAQAMLGDDSMGDAPDSLRLHEGTAYTHRDLLRRMIAYSDNYASQLLTVGVPGEEIDRMLYSLSSEQSFDEGVYYFDARTVASLLRVLYHSSYLSRDRSEQALDLLTQSFYQSGLKKLLPPEVKVASKFGFHASLSSTGPHVELHECGIVYRPRRPYVLCVMTRTDAGTPESLDRILAEVSRILWAQQVD